MKKRMVALLLALVCICGVLPMSVSAADAFPFKDVKKTDKYYEAIKFVYDKALFMGTSATEFSPNVTMTRAMFVTVLGRLHIVNTNDYAKKPDFSDVAAGEWYTPYVAWASENGIVNGYDNGAFGVTDIINVEQATAIIARYVKFKDIEQKGAASASKFKDIKQVSDWAKADLLWAVGNGIYDTAVNLEPKKEASRALVASMICELSAFITKNETPLAPPPDNNGEWDKNVTYKALLVKYDFDAFKDEAEMNHDHSWMIMTDGMNYVEGGMQVKDKALRLSGYNGGGCGFRVWAKKWEGYDYLDLNFSLTMDDNFVDTVFYLSTALSTGSAADNTTIDSPTGAAVFSIENGAIYNFDSDEIGAIPMDGKKHTFKVRMVYGSMQYEVYMDGKLLSKENWYFDVAELFGGLRVYASSATEGSYMIFDDFSVYGATKK